MTPLQLSVEPLDLPLKHTFTIARSSENVARTVIVRVRWNGLEGLGESAPIARYGESIESVSAGLAQLELGDDPYALEALLDGLPPAQACGLDIALHDLIGKDVDRPLWRLLGLDPARTPQTSFTIGIAGINETLAKVREVGAHPVIKVKLGKGAELETIEAIRSIYAGTIRIDANEGWTPEQTVEILTQLAKLRHRVLRAADPRRNARAAALDSRALADPDRDRRRLQGRRTTSRRCAAASTAST